MKYCNDYAALLDLYVDGELPSTDMVRVLSHLDSCPHCQAYVDDALAMRAAFPDIEDAVVPAGFAESVMAAIQKNAAPEKKKTAPWVKVLLPLSACFAIVAVLQSSPIFQGSKGEATPAITTDTYAYSYAESAPAEAPMEFAMDVSEEKTSPEAARTTSSTSTYAEPEEAQTEAAASKHITTNAAAESVDDHAVLLTLTVKDAGTLLDGYTPIAETDTELRYELSADDYTALLAALPDELRLSAPAAPAGAVLIIVEK